MKRRCNAIAWRQPMRTDKSSCYIGGFFHNIKRRRFRAGARNAQAHPPSALRTHLPNGKRTPAQHCALLPNEKQACSSTPARHSARLPNGTAPAEHCAWEGIAVIFAGRGPCTEATPRTARSHGPPRRPGFDEPKRIEPCGCRICRRNPQKLEACRLREASHPNKSMQPNTGAGSHTNERSSMCESCAVPCNRMNSEQVVTTGHKSCGDFHVGECHE